MAAPVCEAIACIIVDQDGDYAVGKDMESARTAYEEAYRELQEGEGFRVVYCRVHIPCPQAVELCGEAPADGTAKLTVS